MPTQQSQSQNSMKQSYIIKLQFFFIGFIILVSNLLGQSQTNERAQWFVDARFGMFIHWGVYSGAEGYWKGEKLRNNNNYAEWIYYRNRIEKEEYLTLLDRFDWDSIDPEKWVILAKKAGMKYVTFTAKHHDGFALWDSKVSDYDVAAHTNPKRDIVKEVAEACKKHGLKLGLYYSHWVDWEHEYGWDHTKEIYPITAEQYNQYWQEKVMPQMRELLTNYGPIDLMWFDMWMHHSKTLVTKEQLLQLKGLIRELQPDCLVNSRLGLSIEEDSDVDYRTMGDNHLGSEKFAYPWQSPATVAHSWGYHATDTRWKSTSTLLKSLIGNVSLNGNLMLNIGPRGNGDVPYEITQRLLKMGEWLDINGESIYGAGAFDLDEDLHGWGKITWKPLTDGKHNLYLYLYNWPYNHKLPVTGITDKPVKSYILKDKSQLPLYVEHNDVFTEISLPYEQPDPLISVVVLEYDHKPEIIDGLVAKTVEGGYSLTHKNLISEVGNRIVKKIDRLGTVPAHTLVNEKYQCKWKIFVDKPGTMTIDVSYSFQGEKPKGTILVNAANSNRKHDVHPTGLTVAEPNKNYHIDNFTSIRVGNINFPDKGIYEIYLEIEAEKEAPIKFQWLWLEMKKEKE
ncbi:MAG: alpha-L-fucosidase [Melioribacteraceae bacterium]|nr:alpha-L-fucosidase [Melioribacteraceae bacterium]